MRAFERLSRWGIVAIFGAAIVVLCRVIAGVVPTPGGDAATPPDATTPEPTADVPSQPAPLADPGAAPFAAIPGEPVEVATGQPIHAFAMSPDGLRFATADAGRVVVRDASTMRPLWSAEQAYPIRSMAFSPGGGLLAAGLADGQIAIWDAHRGEIVRSLLNARHPVTALAWSNDSAGLIAATDRSLVMWNVLEARRMVTFGQHEMAISALASSPREEYFAMTSLGGEIAIRSRIVARSPSVLGTFFEAVYSAAYSPDGRWLATGSESGRIIVWDAALGEPRRNVDGHREGVRALAWARGGSPPRLVSGAGDQQVIVWEIAGDEATPARLRTITGHAARVIGVGFAGPATVISASEDGTIIQSLVESDS